MGLTYTTGNSHTIAGTGEIIIKDFFVYCKGGVPVLSLDAKFDFTDIPPDEHVWVANLLLSRKTRLLGPTDEAAIQMDHRSKRYEDRKTKYEALPWHKKLFAKRPGILDEENDA